MKKILTVIALILTMLCGSAILVSCSNDYKKMYLAVEYCVSEKDDNGKWVVGNWQTVTDEFDYFMTNSNSKRLHMRIKVEGTKKEVESLYISQSETMSVMPESRTVRPGEPFEMIVNTIGSVRFNVIPSQGGEGKSVSFGINVYKQLLGIEQNKNCVPAVVVGGNVKLENLTNLITYKPEGETNQTGVDFKLVSVGTLANDGTENLLGRDFYVDNNYSRKDDGHIYLTTGGYDRETVKLEMFGGRLMLTVASDYTLTNNNNVIKMEASSKYYPDLKTDVYVYIVENFKNNSLLVSYDSNIKLEDGKVPTDNEIAKPVPANITLYNSVVDASVVDRTYDNVSMYTYTNASIYSYESNPGFGLNVFINGVPYNYYNVVNNAFGIQITPTYREVMGVSRLSGLKFAVNPNSVSETNEYHVRLELDFTAFDFSASDKAPVDILNKEFIVTVESLASGFHINGKGGYADNRKDVIAGAYGTITALNSTREAILYTSYAVSAIGMPLNIQATPTDAINTKVYVGFYGGCTVDADGVIHYGNNLAVAGVGENVKLHLMTSASSVMPINASGKFELDFANKNRNVYLQLNKNAEISNIKEVFMVCEVQCTPNSFGGVAVSETKYITYIAKIKVAGSIDDVWVYKSQNDNVERDTLDDDYLANGVTNTAYINFASISGSVDYEEIVIGSANGNIKFFKNGTWEDSITAKELSIITIDGITLYKLEFKTENECTDSLTIASPNGVGKQIEYTFVNVTTGGASEVKIGFESSRIKELGLEDARVGIDGIADEGSVELRYLALQSGSTVQFKAKGNNKTDVIKSIKPTKLRTDSPEFTKITKAGAAIYATANAIPTSTSAINVPSYGTYLFDVEANSVGFTSVLLVKVDFYAIVGDEIEFTSKYFIYEIAVYNPAREITITSDKDSIIYINDNYLDVAKVAFDIEVNKATRAITFSSATINNQINAAYGEGNANSIYGIAVESSEVVTATNDDGDDYFKVEGLKIGAGGREYIDISSRKFTLQALQSLKPLEGQGVISFTAVIYQFGEEISTTQVKKVIAFGEYKSSTYIEIESGVDSYYNVYLSLLNAGAEGVSQQVVAYAANDGGDVTYSELGYRIYQVNTTTGAKTNYTGSNFKVDYNVDTNTFTLTAKEDGGVYELEFYAKDSTEVEPRSIRITVSDGKTKETAYLLKNLEDFKALKNNTEDKHYRLWQDIDVSALINDVEWWSANRAFAGHLYGSMIIQDPNNNNREIYRHYSLIDLTIGSKHTISSDGYCFGLFNSIANGASIEDLVLANVKLEVVLGKDNTGDVPVNIGVVAGINNGAISNCSISLANSNIVFETDGENKSADTNYNIGIVAGINNGTISYETANTGSNYARIVDVESAGKLTIVIKKGNNQLGANTNINIGGVVGKNTKIISANYSDKSSANIREKIDAVVNIEVLAQYDASNEPMNFESLNIGGVVGDNDNSSSTAEIKNIAISGSIIVNDKANVGGIAGVNTGKVDVVANYGAYIEGEERYGADREQNVGGIVGYNNAGIVDNVRVLFMEFTADEVSISAKDAVIKGAGNVAGIIGKATNTQLTRAYVENFVDDVDNNNLNYNIIGINGANVAGLIANSETSSATLSFVNADFAVVGCAFNEFGSGLTVSYAYFIGDVFGNDTDPTATIGSTYIVKHVITTDGTNITRTSKESGVEKVSNPATKIGDFYIKWLIAAEESVNGGYPYLEYSTDNVEWNATLTIRPTEIIVNVDETYFNKDATNFKSLTEEPSDWNSYDWANNNTYYEYDEANNIYVKLTTKPTFDADKHFELVETRFEQYEDGLYIQYKNDDRISATAIVYYMEGYNNTYTLVSEGGNKGLIEKTVLPNINGVDGNYSVGIIAGSTIATLTDAGETITFNGVGRVELKFASILDRSKTDTVVIFVENPLNEDVFNISASSGIEDRDLNQEVFVTHADSNSILTLGMLEADGQVFDSAKTYMTATMGLGTALKTSTDPSTEETLTEIENNIDVSSLFELNALTTEISAGRYQLGEFNVVANKLDATYSYLSIPVTLNVYLNLAEYEIDGKKLNTYFGTTEALLKSKTITIIVYNKATDLTLSASNVKAESGEDVDIDAKLITGYTYNDKGSVTIEDDNIVGSQRAEVLLKIVGQDAVEMVLTAENENAKDLLQTAKNNSANPVSFSIWNLFDAIVTYKKLKSGVGYTYSVNLKLKNEYRYLDLEGYTDREWLFKLQVIASSNPALTKSIDIAFVPQELINFRLENYSNLVSTAGAGGSTVAEFVSSQTESSLIVPGESGLIKIFADYTYSYFDNITVTSSRQPIDGRDYFIRYQQMVYNKDKNVYESYAGITADGETLALKKVSYKVGGEYVYDGVLFVRTILDEFVGLRKTFTTTVNATTYNINGETINISRSKTVISQYRPGVYISVENAISTSHEDEHVYLVEQNSSATTIVARVYGYEFNIEPVIIVTKEDGVTPFASGEIAVVQQGPAIYDATGAYIIRYSLAVNVTELFNVSMKMSLLDNANTLISKTQNLKFYPVPYILKDVHMKGEANGAVNIAVNTSRDIELVFDTNSTTTAKINAINDKIQKLDFLKLFYINQVNASGQDYNKYFTEYLNEENTNFTIKRNGLTDTYRIEALNKSVPMVVHFNLWYGYDLDTAGYPVVFSLDETSICNNLLSHEFNLVLTVQTSEDAPQPISSVEEFLTMAEGENYILMEDITLENWTPLKTAIASLDGNGKVINIKSFNVAVSASMNVGVFDTIDENAILKNVVINIGSMTNNLGIGETAMYIRDNNVTEATINFGLLAGINNGLVYNCEIISMNTSRTLELVVGDKYKLTFGALVGVNNGNITNSRVGTEYFEILGYRNGIVSTAVVDCGQLTFKSKGIMAGFVGQNSANSIISSSFVANTSVENSAVATSDINRTAGFVANNAGNIAYSYVKGYEKNILSTKSTTNSVNNGTESVIYASGNGNAAGFVYMNTGTINDCYSNTVCKSVSAGVAGFVYNTVSGTLLQCYSATRVESGNTNTALATELPFVGVGVDKDEAQQLLSSENLINCYYFEDETEYDRNYRVLPGVVEPKGLTLEAFANNNNLNNYSFIIDGIAEQELNGVWTYSTAIDRNRSTYLLSSTALPELTSANAISRSIRIFADDTAGNSDIKNYVYAKGYEPGSQNNPYIIRSTDEYKSVFIDGAITLRDGTKNKVGYIRFIDNINFKSNNEFINIDTRSKYKLGDENLENKITPAFTLVDGNGMTLSNVIINYTEDETGELGLFSKVYNSVIKGFAIEYATQTNDSGNLIGSSRASYVGGVAGVAKNTYFIDLKLKGNITLRAHNVVGGVVGKITGTNSGLFNIETNLNVQAGNYSNGLLYNSDSELIHLSYAGGIAGIADIGRDDITDTNYNLNKLTASEINVRADRAGGIAGYLGKNINAKRLTYIISLNNQVFGHDVAGGIVADNFANIELSQANREINAQYENDLEFAKYIKNEQDNSAIDNSNNTYGNLSAVTGSDIVGGFIGINYNGNITNSLTKANIGINEQYGEGINIAGGFVGKNYGGDFNFVYAQNFIDLIHVLIDGYNSYEYKTQTVGGFIGELDKYFNGTNYDKVGLDDVVVATWFDKFDVASSTSNIEYVIGKNTYSVELKKKISEDPGPNLYYGKFMDSAKIKVDNTKTAGIFDYNMKDLYYVAEGDEQGGQSIQLDLFNTLFAVWPDIYWDKDHTKFMPNLKTDTSVNYIPIMEEDDIKLMELRPDANFILVKDVTISEKFANFIVNTEFSGVLIGTMDEEEPRYTRFNIKELNANTSRGNGAGFFKMTKGARIANIGFNYFALNLDGGDNFSIVGGVSANDSDSRFEGITVSSESNPHQSATGVKTNTTNITNTPTTVSTIGSIVGEGNRSKILSCDSSLNYDIQTSTGKIGGLVGNINGAKEIPGEPMPISDGLISASKYSGEMTINEIGGGATVGGIVGKAQYSRISDSMANVPDSQDPTKLTPVNINIYSAGKDNNIGGIVGNYNHCSIAYCDAIVSINETSIKDEDDNNYYIGGIAGVVNNTTIMQEDINNSHAKLTYNLTHPNEAYVGGVLGRQEGAADVNLDKLYAELVIDAPDPTLETLNDYTDRLIVGGIVGWIDGKTNITNSMTLLNVDAHYNEALIGGGLIGKATAGYSINYSTAMGYIWANNTDKTYVETNSTSTITVLGGLVGLAGEIEGVVLKPTTVEQQKIENSYSVLTLSTANVYQGDVIKDATTIYTHEVYSNSIVGYTDANNVITASNVLYSSDYTLSFEDGALETVGKFTTAPQNVTANALLASENTLLKKSGATPKISIGQGWMFKNDHLPVPMALTDLLIKNGVLIIDTTDNLIKFVDSNNGQPYAPIMLTEREMDLTGTGYSYYTLMNVDPIISSAYRTLNGVFLGNNHEITTRTNLFDEIGLHSAVSNLTVKLDSSVTTFGYDGIIAETNNGTIFMIGVQYEDVEITGTYFGAIASENNGRIAYCYNNGISVGDKDEVAGLVYSNTKNASIEYSYFTGNISGGAKGSALVANSAGYIANTYTAGLASNIFVPTDSKDQVTYRYENVKYDYYANFVKLSDVAGIGAEGVSTVELQEIDANKGASDSAVFAGWKVYSMYNWDNIYNPASTNNEVDTTYNYGYPIYHVDQYMYFDSNLHQSPIREKRTGNGTFNLITDVGGDAITEAKDANDIVKGKLVAEAIDGAAPAVTQTYNYHDNSSFLINNLGVLYLINKIDTTDKYFELEVDMIMPADATDGVYQEGSDKLISDWKGIGDTASNAFKGVFASSANKADKTENVGIDDVGNDIYAYLMDTTLQTETQQELEGYDINFNSDKKLVTGSTKKFMENLTGNPMFAFIDGGSIIANIELRNSRVNTSALVGEVGAENADAVSAVSTNVTTSTIYNVLVEGIVNNNENVISGFINKVYNGYKLNLHSINQNITFKLYNDTNSKKASGVAGVIVTNEGIVHVANSFDSSEITFGDIEQKANISGFVYYNGNKDTANGAGGKNEIVFVTPVEFTIAAIDKTLSGFSGFAYENYVNIHTIGSANSKISLTSIPVDANNGTLAGFIGSMHAGIVAGFDIEFTNSQADTYIANTFGGIVADMSGGQLGILDTGALQTASATGSSDSKTIKVTLSSATADLFGGIIAKTSGSGAIVNVELDGNKVTVKPGNGSGIAYGLVVGLYEQYTEIYYSQSGIKNFVVIGGVNVGGVVGKATTGRFNFSNDKPNEFTVEGYGNVGGFIGYYENETEGLSVSGEAWVLGDDGSGAGSSGYASVELAMDATNPPDGVTEVKASNFGGLIGYWKSNVSLTGDATRTNYNNVLIFEADIAKDLITKGYVKAKKKTDKAYDIVISNVGGIVGCVEAGSVSNMTYAGKIGKAQSTDPGVTDAVINASIQSTYVGGIVGYAEGAITINGSSSSGEIIGMYAVGGIIGGATDDTATITISSSEEMQISNVFGIIDVGGLVGRTKATFTCKIEEVDPSAVASFKGVSKTSEPTASYTIESVIGVANVGGLIGRGTVNISNISVLAEKVYGNLNVGAIVGVADGGNINSIEVLKDSNVYGSVINYAPDGNEVLYAPTNIGGVVGQAVSAEFIEVKSNVYVQTYVNGKFNVSMAKNYMGNTELSAELYGTNLINYFRDKYYATGKNYINYDKVNGGIGGFAGTLRPSATTASSCIVNGDVYAPHGINVGGMVGFVDGAGNTKELPSVDDAETLRVAGAINIGGYIGKSGPFDLNEEFFGGVAGTKVSNIHIQSYKFDKGPDVEYRVLPGKAIGGVVGYVTGNVYNINLTIEDQLEYGRTIENSKIKIFNAVASEFASDYVGTLVGKMDGNVLQNCSIAPNLCGAKLDSTTPNCDRNSGTGYVDYYKDEDEITDGDIASGFKNGIIQEPNQYNYGGLVGLVDLQSGAKLTISGTHYYAFTVDLIQNRDYERGASVYQDTGDALVANAHYINNSQLNIVASGLTGLYNYTQAFPGAPVTHNNYNPILGEDHEGMGWAKEYTMFRSMARVINQDGEPTGDSIQVIYNAAYITWVETTSGYLTETNTVLDNRNLTKDIVFTVYKPVGQMARLYCEYGIATESQGFNPNEEMDVSDELLFENYFNYELNHKVEFDGTNWYYGGASYFDKFYNMVKIKNDSDTNQNKRLAFWTHITDVQNLPIKDIEKNIEEAKNAKGWKFTEGIDDNVDDVCDVHHLTFGYSYYIIPGSNTKLGYMRSKENTYFTFDTVFGQYADQSGNVYSKSGSLFEVRGKADFPEVEVIKNKEAWLNYFWGFLGGAAVGAMLFVPGLNGLVVGALASSSTFWVWALGYYLGTSALVSVAGLATMGALGAGITALIIGNMTSQAIFAQIEEVPMGYLASTYGHTVKWNGNTLDPTFDSVLMVNFDCELGFTGDDEGLNYITIPYYACSSARYVPNDMELTVEYPMNKFGHKVFNKYTTKYNKETFTVSKYQKENNDLYCCLTNFNENKILYPNYDDVKGTEETDKNGNNYEDGLTLRNNDGYAYLLADVANGDHIAQGQGEEYLYGVSLTKNFSVKHSITKTEQTSASDNLTMSDEDKQKVRWVVSKTLTSENVDNFIFERNVDVMKEKPNNSMYGFEDKIISIQGTKPNIECKTEMGYTFTLSKLNFDINGNSEDIHLNDTVWFEICVENAYRDTSFILEPIQTGIAFDGNCDEYGLTFTGLGYDSNEISSLNIYYQIDPNGSFNVNRTFKLSKLTNGNKLSGNVLGTLQSTSAIFTVYDANGNEITPKKTISDVIKAECGNGWDGKGWYVDKVGTRIADKYFVDDGKLYYKEANKYLKDSQGNYYKIVYEADMGEDANFTNRYVYKSGAKKLYTRYYYGDNFLNQDLNPAEDAETCISSLLIGFGTMDRRFEESARISLAINGEFTCVIPPNMLPKYWQ